MKIQTLKIVMSVVALAGVFSSTAGAQSNQVPGGAPDPRFATWAALTRPAQGDTQIIGGYSLGCIIGAEELSMNNPDYVVMRPSARRNFAHPVMIKYLEELADTLRADGVPPMRIEDLSGARGGPVAKGHASHQNGLDADISFALSRKPLTLAEREEYGPSFVIDRKVLKPEWGEMQTKLLSRAAQAPNVNRIFVAPGIKKFMCENFPNEPWLYKIRAYWGHDDHLHVRLNCPPGETKCKVQAALNPAEKQCGKDLDYWFSKAADEAAASGKAHLALKIPKVYPKMPAACEAIRAQ